MFRRGRGYQAIRHALCVLVRAAGDNRENHQRREIFMNKRNAGQKGTQGSQQGAQKVNQKEEQKSMQGAQKDDKRRQSGQRDDQGRQRQDGMGDE
jgi:hypothetical protein